MLFRIALIVVLSVPLVSFSATPQLVEEFPGEQRAASPEQSGEHNRDTEEANRVREMLHKTAFILSLVCENIYPKPTLEECFDHAHHSIVAIDPHSEYQTRKEAKFFEESLSGKFGGIGTKIYRESGGVLLSSIFPNTPAEKAGLREYDIITHIDGVPTSSFSTISEITANIRGKPGSKVVLTILREGVNEPLDFEITREEVEIELVKGEIIEHSKKKRYALIEISQFTQQTGKQVENLYRKLSSEKTTDGIIVSLEGNGGGLVRGVVETLDLFLDSPTFVLFRTNNGLIPQETDTPETGDISGGLPMLVLVDDGSASGAEIFAANMKLHYRALIAGTSKTFGKGSIQRFFNISDGSRVKMTVAEFLAGTEDNWVPVQCVGVTPDVLFEYSVKKAGKVVNECDLAKSMKSKGPMDNPPERISFQEKDPAAYEEGLCMLETYKAYKEPKLKEREEKLKKLEEKARRD